ncbi:hypothetical protein E3J38_05635 [candidate division TA06 bacterium]|uniref:AP2/ERF domain-containing protein n=1 Tax=candidate division TA06 bacterium TaxID=2250710 RepID=A0A523XMD1_UNCT6|nr:MAG: hypothetical protein E3J38_05635 [candidate division TA06 bacterium]
MAEILLTQGKVAIVDDADYDWLNQWGWFAHRDRHTFYAVRGVHLAKYRQGIQSMHRLILGLRRGDKRQCDHRDGNGLNNQRANLRRCTRAQNQQSRRNLPLGTSRYKGVCWSNRDRKWRSQIRVNRKWIHLGLFDSEITAARAYDARAIKQFGEFALTNKTLEL